MQAVRLLEKPVNSNPKKNEYLSLLSYLRGFMKYKACWKNLDRVRVL